MKATILLLVFLFAVNAMAALQTVNLKNGKGEAVGTATITPMVKGVKIIVDLKGLSPGEHAIHFHEKASCVGPKFDSAGGHLNPAKAKHGFDMEGGPHAGDMANLIAAADGTAKAELVNAGLTMNDLKSGAALVVHEKADDYKSQPSGDAGGRWACGEIK